MSTSPATATAPPPIQAGDAEQIPSHRDPERTALPPEEGDVDLHRSTSASTPSAGAAVAVAAAPNTTAGADQTTPPAWASSKTCKFWAEGYCYRGSLCWYRHGAATPPVGATSSSSSSSTPHAPGPLDDVAPTSLSPQASSFQPRSTTSGTAQDDDHTQDIVHTNSVSTSHVAAPQAVETAIPEQPSCSICYEMPASYGLLDNCSHPFCLACIRQWRQGKDSSDESVVSGMNKRCPSCRGSCLFITPSSLYHPQGPAKEAVVHKYKETLSRKPCRFFEVSKNSSRGPNCKFGDECHYAHHLTEGDDRYVFGGGFQEMASRARRRREQGQGHTGSGGGGNGGGRRFRRSNLLASSVLLDLGLNPLDLAFATGNGNNPADWDHVDFSLPTNHEHDHDHGGDTNQHEHQHQHQQGDGYNPGMESPPRRHVMIESGMSYQEIATALGLPGDDDEDNGGDGGDDASPTVPFSSRRSQRRIAQRNHLRLTHHRRRRPGHPASEVGAEVETPLQPSDINSTTMQASNSTNSNNSNSSADSSADSFVLISEPTPRVEEEEEENGITETESQDEHEHEHDLLAQEEYDNQEEEEDEEDEEEFQFRCGPGGSVWFQGIEIVPPLRSRARRRRDSNDDDEEEEEEEVEEFPDEFWDSDQDGRIGWIG